MTKRSCITIDESLVYGYDTEAKLQSLQWIGKRSLPPDKARQSLSNVKMTLTFFFDFDRVVQFQFLP